MNGRAKRVREQIHDLIFFDLGERRNERAKRVREGVTKLPPSDLTATLLISRDSIDYGF